MMLESWKVAPALAWGNTVVLKPAEDTPASAVIMARLALEAGIPPGVFNVIHGYGPDSVGELLTTDPHVDRITFTGESGTGKIIAGAAERLTPEGILVVEIGNEREYAEAAFGHLGLTWLTTSIGDDAVFLLTAEQLQNV